jgi:tetrapyrrole methylase family protein / MazG family protein
MASTTNIQQIEGLTGIEKLVAVVAQLRHPEQGCPWDLKQTHASLKPYMLEEAYEAIEAIDSGEPESLKEELGDVLLQVVLHAQLAQDVGVFDFSQVCQGIADKLIRRHPHVFGESTVSDAEGVVNQWEAIKKTEKQQEAVSTEKQSILHGVPKNLPALSRALETSKRAVKVGFEWPSIESLWECVMSEFAEFKHEADHHQPFERLEEEMGDIFFATVNLARHYKIDPEVALTRATAKFTQRFQAMERLVGERSLESLDFETWDHLWNQAKAECHQARK